MGSEIKTLNEALACIESMKAVQGRLHKRVADLDSELERVRVDIRQAAEAAREHDDAWFGCESDEGAKGATRCREILDALVASDPVELQAKKDARFWEHIKRCKEVVAGWPEWKRRACSFAATDSERLRRIECGEVKP